MVPALTLFVPSLLNAVGIRLLLYVGASGGVDIASRYMIDKKEGRPKFLYYISMIEIIAGVAIFWTGFSMFFSSNIDYNARYLISITLTLGAPFVAYGFLDRRHSRVIIYPARRSLYLRLITAVIAVALAKLYTGREQQHRRYKKNRMVRAQHRTRDCGQSLYTWARPDRNLEV